MGLLIQMFDLIMKPNMINCLVPLLIQTMFGKRDMDSKQKNEKRPLPEKTPHGTQNHKGAESTN